MKTLLPGTLILLLAACTKPAETTKPDTAAAPAPPEITMFYGNARAVPKGGSVTLCFGTRNATEVTMEPSSDPSAIRPSFNLCVAESPKEKTTYTLTARGPGGETKSEVTVGIGGAKDGILIHSFTSYGNLPIPKGQSIQLCYTTEGAESVSLSPPSAEPLVPGKAKCFMVAPQKTTNYILTAQAAGGEVDRMQVTIPVQ